MDMYLLISVTVSFFIAALSGLGVGSGGLFVIWLTATASASITTARGLNLLFFVFSAGGALIVHIKRKRIVPSLVILPATLAALGTVIGSLFGSLASPILLKRMFGIMLLSSGIRTLFSQNEKSGRTKIDFDSFEKISKSRKNY